MKRILGGWYLLLSLFLLLLPLPVWAAGEKQTESLEEDLLDSLDTRQMQEIMDELLEEDDVSFMETLKRMISGEEVFSMETFGNAVKRSLLGEFETNRASFGQVLLLAFAGAVLTSFVQTFDQEKIGDICFYMIYLLVFVILLKTFGTLSEGLQTTIEGTVSFMQALAPSYYLVITAASGTTSAAMFYQVVLIVIFCVEYLLSVVMVPAVHIYILLEFINLMTKEEMLSKISELLKSLILWAQKSMLAVVVGMQVIQSLVAPAVDSLRRSMLGKTVSVIPGVGNAVNAVTEILFGSAILIRNCFGAAVLVVLILISISPVIKLGLNALIYKFTGALIQPICDIRLVGCFQAMGEGCALLLKLLFTTQVLFMVTIVILANTL